MSEISTIAFDADDTLWDNTFYYNLTEDKFANLLSEFTEYTDLRTCLLGTEKKNIQFYGFGIKGFTLSMIETAIEVTQSNLPNNILKQILNLGRELQKHPVDLYPNVRHVLESLIGNYRIMLITKGDLIDQEYKIALSGLRELFHHVEIVSDKTCQVYSRLFHDYADGPEKSVMVGNSIRSDILPALATGAWGILIPCKHDWEYERADLPTNNPRFRIINQIGEVLDTIQEIVML